MILIFKEVNLDFSELRYTSSVSASTWPSNQYWVIFEHLEKYRPLNVKQSFSMAYTLLKQQFPIFFIHVPKNAFKHF
jgi:hypothetical protein